MKISNPTSGHTPTNDASGTTPSVDVQHFIEQIDDLQPGKQRQKSAFFQKMYPSIERAIARDVPQKTVVAQLAKMGFSFSIGGFRSQLEAERKHRIERGDSVLCEHCGSALPASSNTSNTKDSPTLAGYVPKNPAQRETGD